MHLLYRRIFVIRGDDGDVLYADETLSSSRVCLKYADIAIN